MHTFFHTDLITIGAGAENVCRSGFPAAPSCQQTPCFPYHSLNANANATILLYLTNSATYFILKYIILFINYTGILNPYFYGLKN